MRRALFFLALVLGACQRKAPGPEECVHYAYRAVGVVQAEELERASVREKVDELTRICLVTPFDREFISCVEATGRTRACGAEFGYRQRERLR
jgi:hypothetical protein